jgi:cell division transport system permease protein
VEEKATKRTTNRVSAVLSIALVIFMLGLTGLIVVYAMQLDKHLRQNLPFTVFIKNEANPDQIKGLQKKLEAAPYSSKVVYIDKATALERYKKDIGEDFMDLTGENFLEPSLEVNLKTDYTTVGEVAKIKAALVKDPIVSDVTYSETVTGELNKTAKNIGAAILGFSILLLIVCVSLINSSIRLDIYSQRLLIKSMLLVGATQAFIRRPFISRAFLNGIIAWTIAGGLLALTVAGLVYQQSNLEFNLLLDYKLLAPLAGALLLLGLLISYLSTLIALQLYLKTRTDQLY